jgi:hypothetical protein
MRRLLKNFFGWLRPLRVAKYRPAPRTGTRRVENRLLRRLAWNTAETAR